MELSTHATRLKLLERNHLHLMAITTIGLAAGVTLTVPAAWAAGQAPPSLKEIKVPEVNNIDQFIEKKDKAIRLGKSLFWDMAVGSDGQACASCHFRAGVDHRIKNQLTPGMLRVPNPDNTFQQTRSGGNGGPNYTLVKEDFPFHSFNDPNDRSSGVEFTTNDVASSQGTFGGDFVDIPAR